MKRLTKTLAVVLVLTMILVTGTTFAAEVRINDKENQVEEVKNVELLYAEKGTDVFENGVNYDFENKSFSSHGARSFTNNDGPVAMSGTIMWSQIHEKTEEEFAGMSFHGCGYYAFWIDDVPENVKITSAKAYYKEQGLHITYDDISWLYFGDKSKLNVSLGYEECLDFELEQLDKTQIRVLDRENYYSAKSPGTTVMVTFVLEGTEDGEAFIMEETLSAVTLRKSAPLSIYSTFDKIFNVVK
ncbi:MAG: hypothetical protein IJC14_05515 [Firmicutes bacterium]|nr:hypothetical protein [Bacillota bacterium]